MRIRDPGWRQFGSGMEKDGSGINIPDLQHCKKASNPPTCWDYRLYGHKPQSFPPNQSSKMRESQQLVFGLRLVSNIRNPKKNNTTLWRIFSLNKHAPANRKKGFYKNRNPNKQVVGLNFV